MPRCDFRDADDLGVPMKHFCHWVPVILFWNIIALILEHGEVQEQETLRVGTNVNAGHSYMYQ